MAICNFQFVLILAAALDKRGSVFTTPAVVKVFSLRCCIGTVDYRVSVTERSYSPTEYLAQTENPSCTIREYVTGALLHFKCSIL